MSSVLTRAKPNAFNALHQLQRRLKQGETAESVLGANESSKTLRSLFGFSQQEGAAVQNLVHHIPASCKAVLEGAVATYGIVRGPVTHGALASPAIRLGHEPDLIAPDWCRSMKNTQTSLQLAVERLVADYTALPAGLRKPAGPADVVRMTRIARCWELVLAKFSKQIPHKLFLDESNNLDGLFRKRCFDDYLHAMVEECPAEISLQGMPEFQKILVKHQHSIDQA